MQRERFIILVFLCVFVANVMAQNATNVEARQEGNLAVITYTLDKTADVTVQVSTDGGRTFSAPLTKVTGDVGRGVWAGNNRIVWDILAERNRLVGANIVFRVNAISSKNAKKKTRQSKTKKYDGIGGFNKCHFQIYITAPFKFGSTTKKNHDNSSLDYTYYNSSFYNDETDLGMGLDVSLGLRAKKFFFIGANSGYIYNMISGSSYIPLGAHAIVYFPTGKERVSENSYPFISAVFGGYFGGGKQGFYYQIGVGYDLRTIAHFSIGYTGLSELGNYLHCKIGFRLGKQ